MRCKKYKIELLFFLLVLVFTAVLTYPTWLHISEGIYGKPDSDQPGSAYFTWWLQFTAQHHLDPKALWISAPWGWDQAFIWWQPLWFYLVRFLGYFLNHFSTLNILLLLSFPLTFLTSYVLVYECCKDKLSSLIASFIFTFCPYHVERAQIHFSLAHIEFLPLAILSLLKLVEKPTPPRALLCGFSFILVASSDFYYGYFMVLFALFFFMIRVFARWISWKEVKGYMIASLTFTIVCGVFYRDQLKALLFRAPYEKTLRVGLYERNFQDLFQYSVKPLDYFLPYIDNPFFGGIASFFRQSPMFGYNKIEFYTEHIVFIGFTTPILAFFGIRIFKRENKRLFLIFVLSGLFFLCTSFAPYWKFEAFTLYFPSYFLYKLMPIIRSYGRIGILFQFIVVVFVAFGIKKLLLGKSSIKKIIFSTVVLSLITIEFINIPPFHFLGFDHVPEVYPWLRKQPGDFSIAEYPLGDISDVDQYIIIYQPIHQKKLLNFCVRGSEACHVIQKLHDLNNPDTFRYLRTLGVEYIVYRFRNNNVQELSSLKTQKGLQLIFSCDNEYIWLFKIVAQPKDIKELL